jgi:hypothetical protein
MIGVKKKKNFTKKKRIDFMALNSISRIEKVLSEESYHGVGAVMCCSLNCCQHFFCEMMGFLRHEL